MGEPSPEVVDRSGNGVGSRTLVGVMAGLLAVGAVALAWVAFRTDPGPSVPAVTYTPPPVLTLWPESALSEDTTRGVQASADRGDRRLAWRTEPDKLVHAFIASVLGWADARARTQYSGVQAPIRWYTVTQTASCAPGARCPRGLESGPILRIQLIQPERQGAGGIWSVAAVRSSELHLTVSAGPPTSGAIEGAAGRAAGIRTLAGARWYDGCRVSNETLDSVTRPSQFDVVLPRPSDVAEPGCGAVAGGYAYVYAVAERTVPVGDPLLESAPIEDLAIVPIRVRVAGRAA